MMAIDLIIKGLLLVATWGAVFANNSKRYFWRGFAIVGWAVVAESAFDRYESYIEYTSFVGQSTPINKCAAYWFGHQKLLPQVSAGSDQGYNLNTVGMFYRTWHLFSILNCGLLGGYMALTVAKRVSKTDSTALA
jgi:hypothetical protein